ncbi:hypothetical protein BT96DRAFT_915496 [Gymnopus androsaceus JB14]|uniref:DUF6533 domain-containing protein n=1 Tax=Gymnopus androsaceus JB14 TaxID=1447944 RepID=A0A6A4IAD8_9AGAR|nr:hypothetical protein BT96DRAFT_915496 [Gymnopus androsaceus JB14]
MAGINYLEYEIQYASIVLIWYDWILMLPMEIKYIWGAKIRVSTVIYILCHYALLANILYILAISNAFTDSLSCDTWYKIIGALSVLGRTAILYTFIARTYAVWRQNRIAYAYLATLGIICIGLDIAHVPGLSCVGSSTIPIANDLLSILMVIFEFSSAILVSVRCIQTFKELRRADGRPRRGFWDLHFEQAILYFSFISIFTTASVILDFRASAGFYQRLLNALTLPLSGLLTSRFILYLRKCDDLAALGLGSQVATRNSAAEGGGILSTIINPDFGSEWGPVDVDGLERARRGGNYDHDLEGGMEISEIDR